MRRKSAWGTGCLILIFIGLCVVTIAAGAAWFIPRSVADEIGPADAQLGTLQRALVTWQLFFKRGELIQAFDPNGQKRTFTVRLGETANSVAARLQETGLISDGETFRLYLVYAGMDTTIQAGDYQLSPTFTMVEIAQELQDATPAEVEFNILPGWRVEEIAAALPTSGLQVAPQGFLQLVRTGRAGIAPENLKLEGSLEGFLMPGTYRFLREARAEDMVKMFTARFDEQVPGDLRGQFEANGLNLREAVILASIVQREAVLEEEQPMIASVFFNRLAVGMSLESDPTVQYALGYNAKQQTWWTNPLTADDLSVDSPYNTYRNGGLPPGPIGNPRLSALKAVAYPAQTPYYYFRAACDQSGRHSFAKTYEEHLQNSCP
jgi:UPF0755 protein